MEPLETQSNERKIIEINSPVKKVSSLSLLVTLALFLSILVLISITIGYLFGKNQLNQSQKNLEDQTVKITNQGNGKSEYLDPNEKIKFIFPSDWTAISNKEGPKGGSFENTTGKIEFWLIVDQPLTLNSEQKEGLESVTEIEVEINKQKASGTEYIYKAGNYLTVLQLRAQNNKPQITFWLQAKDKETYDIALEIVKSLTFIK